MTPFDPEVLLLRPACCARISLSLRINVLAGTAQLLDFSV